MADYCEDGETGEEGSEGVDANDDEGIGENVVVELVVGRQGYQPAPCGR